MSDAPLQHPENATSAVYRRAHIALLSAPGALCRLPHASLSFSPSRRFEQSLLRRTDRGQAIQPKLLFFLEGFPIFAASLENLTEAPLDRNHSPQRAFPRC